jgi:Domain of unknown function (DUF4326)
MIEVVNRHKHKNPQPTDVNIMRPSPMGNSNKIGTLLTQEQVNFLATKNLIRQAGSPSARHDVVLLYSRDLFTAILYRTGPVFAEFEHLCHRYLAGENLVLVCCCAPLPCHGHKIAKAIEWYAPQLIADKPEPTPALTRADIIAQTHTLEIRIFGTNSKASMFCFNTFGCHKERLADEQKEKYLEILEGMEQRRWPI